MTDLFSEPRSPILALGVGTLGCRAAARGALNARAAGADAFAACAEWAGIHGRIHELLAAGPHQRLHIPLAEGPFRQRSAWGAVEQRAADLLRWMRGKTVLLVLAELSDDDALALSAPLASFARDNGLLAIQLFAGDPAQAPAPDSSAHLQAVLAELPQHALTLAEHAAERERSAVRAVETLAHALQHHPRLSAHALRLRDGPATAHARALPCTSPAALAEALRTCGPAAAGCQRWIIARPAEHWTAGDQGALEQAAGRGAVAAILDPDDSEPAFALLLELAPQTENVIRLPLSAAREAASFTGSGS